MNENLNSFLDQFAKPPSGRHKRYVYGDKGSFYLKYRKWSMEQSTSSSPPSCFSSFLNYILILYLVSPFFAEKKFESALKREHIGFLKGTAFESKVWVDYETALKELKRYSGKNTVRFHYKYIN